jgi:hypothetical protein
MKKFIHLLFLVSLFIIFSCGGGTTSEDKESSGEVSEEASEEATTEKSDKPGDKVLKDCDDFLDSYEEWITLYIQVLKEYQKNPYDSKTIAKYTEAATEAAKWAEDWTKLHTCMYNEKYQKRFEEIAASISKSLEEEGIE